MLFTLGHRGMEKELKSYIESPFPTFCLNVRGCQSRDYSSSGTILVLPLPNTNTDCNTCAQNAKNNSDNISTSKSFITVWRL
jgi:hypothetical protein